MKKGLLLGAIFLGVLLTLNLIIAPPFKKVDIENDLTVGGNITATYGFFDFLGSSISRITNGWFTGLNVIDLIVDTNTLFVDSTSHNVGIGTTNPNAKLDVNGSILASNFDTTNENVLVGTLARLNSMRSLTMVGFNAGMDSLGNGNVFVGIDAGAESTGNANTVIGARSGVVSIGNELVFLGAGAGEDNIGDRNIGIGEGALGSNTGSDVVAIGYNAGAPNTASDQFILKQAIVNSVPLIQGNFSSGYVGIGTTIPQNRLNVIGNTNSTGGFIVGPNTGITANYSVGNCWVAFSGGIAYSSNCTKF